MTPNHNPALRDWFLSLDRWSLLTFLLLLILGSVVSFSISPDIATRLKVSPYHLAFKHLAFASLTFLVIIICSFLSVWMVKRLCLYLLIASFVMLVLVLLVGENYNGSYRWLALFGISLQPSEFIKPAFAIVTAWLLSMQNKGDPVPGLGFTLIIYLAIISLLLLQPDIGQTIFITLIFLVQWFVAGMPIILIMVWVTIFLFGLVVAYVAFPHVTDRVQGFLLGSDHYSQVNLSLKAFNSAGFLGEGLGGGSLKGYLFDAQSDFIFAILGEELGIFACIILVLAYGFIVLRGILRAMDSDDLFVLFAIVGLLTQFAVHVWVNVSSVIGLIPPKGTTLPFISSGGTAMVSMGIAMGILLALGRKPPEKQSHYFKPSPPIIPSTQTQMQA